MKPWGLAQLLLTLATGFGVWALVALACMCVGSTSIGWPHDPQNPTVFTFRLETVLLASLIGAALGASGVTYQAILRNPLADPYLLGVSSGASLLSLLWYVGSLEALTHTPLGAAGQQISSLIGAVASVALVLLISSRRGRLDPVTLILVGVIVNAVNGSLFLLVFFQHPEVTSRGGQFGFLVGGIQTLLSTQQKYLATAAVAVGWIVLAYLSGQLNVASLGEAEAQSLGVHIQRLRWVALVVASLVTAAVVAISGPIGFVGLISPHVARLVAGHDQRRLFPLATAFAAALLALADAASRYLSQESLFHTQFPVGVLTGLMGGPFFLFLLYRSRRPGAEIL